MNDGEKIRELFFDKMPELKPFGSLHDCLSDLNLLGSYINLVAAAGLLNVKDERYAEFYSEVYKMALEEAGIVQ